MIYRVDVGMKVTINQFHLIYMYMINQKMSESENKLTIQSLIALSRSNSWTDLDWSWMFNKSFSVVVFILPLRLPLQSFIAENVQSLATDVGGKQRIKSKSLNTFRTPWLANWVWNVGQVKDILLWYLRENKNLVQPSID